jgi:Arc/MetJ-type ribon-helix-helix transcriptional regulator
MSDTDEQGDIFPPEYVAAYQAQAAELKAEAAEHGLRFEAFFVPSIAEWVLGEVERGRFLGPSEAVFVAMQMFMELEAYPDLRKELLKREITKSLDDPRPSIPAEQVFAELDAMAKRMAERQPPTWQRIPFPQEMDGQEP